MKVRLWEEDDVLPGKVKFDPAYLRHALASGMHVALVAEHGGYLYGSAEAGMLLHTTRGRVLRIRSLCGADEATRPFLLAMKGEAVRRGCSVLYLSSTPGEPDLCTAAMTMKFTRMTDDFVMRRPKGLVRGLSVPGVVIRPMRAEEYGDVRQRLIKIVSHGDYVAEANEVRRFLDSRLFFPYVAETEGVIAAYAELDLLHAVLAACPVGRIERVAVVPEWRGRHISQALVGELLRRAERLGCANVELNVSKENAAAIKTYDRLGFMKTDRIPYYMAL